jgi:hypothetical protein
MHMAWSLPAFQARDTGTYAGPDDLLPFYFGPAFLLTVHRLPKFVPVFNITTLTMASLPGLRADAVISTTPLAIDVEVHKTYASSLVFCD